jgi:hypothetical protein
MYILLTSLNTFVPEMTKIGAAVDSAPGVSFLQIGLLRAFID